MGAEIHKELGIEPELIRGRDGVFDVRADGDLVYSKHETGRFPSEAEVIAALKERSDA